MPFLSHNIERNTLITSTNIIITKTTQTLGIKRQLLAPVVAEAGSGCGLKVIYIKILLHAAVKIQLPISQHPKNKIVLARRAIHYSEKVPQKSDFMLYLFARLIHHPLSITFYVTFTLVIPSLTFSLPFVTFLNQKITSPHLASPPSKLYIYFI